MIKKEARIATMPKPTYSSVSSTLSRNTTRPDKTETVVTIEEIPKSRFTETQADIRRAGSQMQLNKDCVEEELADE